MEFCTSNISVARSTVSTRLLQSVYTDLRGGSEASLSPLAVDTDGVLGRALIGVNPVVASLKALGVAAVDILTGGGWVLPSSERGDERTESVKQLHTHT